MTREGIGAALREFIVSEAGLSDPGLLDDDTNLFESGMLDSLLSVALLGFCEDRFQCELDLGSLESDDISSVRNLSNLIFEKTHRVDAST